MEDIIKIEKDESFTKENLLNIIITNNKEALKNLIDEISRIIDINWETYDRLQRTIGAIEAADLTEFNEYETLRKVSQELYKTNLKYNILLNGASKALEKLN